MRENALIDISHNHSKKYDILIFDRFVFVSIRFFYFL